VKKVGTKRTTSVRRVAMAVLAASFVIVGLVPQVSYAQTDGETKCDAGEELRDGVCVPIECSGDQVPEGPDGSCVPKCAENEELTGDGTCKKIEFTCWDDTKAPKEEDCPPRPAPNPCPDGSDFCEQIRSCPTDTPLPQGSTCDDPPPTTTTAPPVPPAASPTGDRGTFGRPAVVAGEGQDRPSPAAPAPPAAPAVPDSLARTGMNEWLAVIGTLLVMLGVVLVRWSSTRPQLAHRG
jgi:hypothetical protein